MITFPITDPGARFTFILNGETRRGKHWPNKHGTADGLDPALVYMQETRAADPVIDPLTHRLGPVEWVDNPADESTVGTRTVIAWTAEELAGKTKEEAKEAELDAIKGIYQDLRDGVGTAEQRLARVEKVVARLLRDRYTMPQ